MSTQPLTPTRKMMLEAYIKCLKRAEKRIIRAHHVATGAGYDADYKPATGKSFLHIVERIRASGHQPHAMALTCLRLKRSKLTAELMRLKW